MFLDTNLYLLTVLWSEKFLKTHYTTRSCCACKILLVYIFRVIAIHIGYTRPFKIRSMLIELRNWTPPHKAFGGWWFLFRFPFSFVPPENKSRVVGLLCFKKHSTLLPHSKQYHIAFIMTSSITLRLSLFYRLVKTSCGFWMCVCG